MKHWVMQTLSSKLLLAGLPVEVVKHSKIISGVCINAEFVMCGAERTALQLFLLVLSLLRVEQTEQHGAVCISAEFVMCGRERAALQLFVLVLS
jgi:hypothetical protein